MYLGARPIADALAAGADIVVTGRVADASLFVGPLAHEFGGRGTTGTASPPASSSATCSSAAARSPAATTPGAWWENPDPMRIAFPIAEVEADGSAVHHASRPGTGGMLTFDTVREQLLYEVHDPAAT